MSPILLFGIKYLTKEIASASLIADTKIVGWQNPLAPANIGSATTYFDFNVCSPSGISKVSLLYHILQ